MPKDAIPAPQFVLPTHDGFGNPTEPHPAEPAAYVEQCYLPLADRLAEMSIDIEYVGGLPPDHPLNVLRETMTAWSNWLSQEEQRFRFSHLSMDPPSEYEDTRPYCTTDAACRYRRGSRCAALVSSYTDLCRHQKAFRKPYPGEETTA